MQVLTVDLMFDCTGAWIRPLNAPEIPGEQNDICGLE